MSRKAPRTKLVAILNITPDSFSGSPVHDAKDALAQVDALIADGANIIDIGAESTRPNATPLTHTQEWERLSGVVALAAQRCHDKGIELSIDTRHAETAKRALDAGADWINDVSGFASSDMIEAVKDSTCKLVMMHSLSVPVDPAVQLPERADAPAAIIEWAIARQHILDGHGIHRNRVILDPGLGFGKSARQSLDIVLRARLLESLGLDILIGHSRKSFLTLFTGAPASERDDLTLAFSAMMVQMQVPYLRVHDVARHHELLKVLYG